MSLKKYFTFTFLFTLVCMSAKGDLIWKETEISTHGQGPSINAAFHFENAGPNIAVIYDIRGTCPCVGGTSDKPEYKKGEKGILTAVFSVGQHTGIEKKRIFVRTTDKAVYILTLVVTIDSAEEEEKNLR